MGLLLLGTTGIATVISFALTWVVRGWARNNGWMSGPISRRHVHTTPVPRLGGAAIFASVAASSVLARSLGYGVPTSILCGYLVSSGWMFLVGFVDDFRGLRPSRKLAGQVLGGIVLFSAGIQIPLPFSGTSPWFATAASFVLTVLWSVAVMNAINLVDGLDGLAAGSSLFVVAGVLVVALLASEPAAALVAVVAIGSLAGFLCFNIHPASIFLGDSGSLVLGSLIAAATIRIMNVSPFGWLACPLLLAHPLGEIVISTIRRFLRGDPIARPDRRHLHHRLLDRGLSHPHASGVLVMASVVCCVLGVLVFLGGSVALTVLPLGLAGLALGVVELRYAEFGHFWRWVRQSPKHRKVIQAHMRLETLKRNISEVRSLTELRIRLSEAFVAIGCESARLRVRSYDSVAPMALVGQNLVAIAFPLHANNTRLGTLELTWDVRAGHWPLDAEVFTTQFLPVLSRQLERFVHLYSELPAKTRVQVFPTELLPRLAAEARTDLRVPLNS